MMSDIEGFGIITTIYTSDKNMKELFFLLRQLKQKMLFPTDAGRSLTQA